MEIQSLFEGIPFKSFEGVATPSKAERMKKMQDALFKTFVSAEPLLSSVEFVNDGMLLNHSFGELDWLIIGGESGNENGKYKYRPCDLEWMRDLVWQSQFSKTAVFVKQLGTFLAKEMELKDSHGGDITEFPEDLQIREMPF